MDGVFPRRRWTCIRSSRLPRGLSYSQFIRVLIPLSLPAAKRAAVENKTAVLPVLT
jgi:hypothetical protein